MTEFVAETVIAAPPKQVWEVLIDFAAYDQWHPYLTIDGRAKRFGWVSIASRKLASPDATARARAIILRLDAEKSFEYVTGNPFALLTKRWFHLQPHPSGTLLRHGIRFTGLSARRILSEGHNIERFRPYFEAEAQALWRRAISGEVLRPKVGNRRNRRATKAKSRHKV